MKRLGGFTLVELLVVIAIIAILAAILFPVFSSARRQARVSQCVSNARQVGMAVRMYVDAYNGTWPIFFAYNSQPPAGHPDHKGVEVQLYPYVKDKRVFGCAEDKGGPYQELDVPGTRSYLDAYGTSFRYTKCVYTTIAGYSSSNNRLRDYTYISRDSSFQYPANTRIMRDEMMSFFSRKHDPGCAKYGYDCDPPWDYFREWHATGGTLIFADGHAKFVTSPASFDATFVDAAGHESGAPHPTEGSWYWACD
ncbi:MAG: hypothetical protein AMXMBFR61_20740 [Fimbriimonadales bacterium]